MFDDPNEPEDILGGVEEKPAAPPQPAKSPQPPPAKIPPKKPMPETPAPAPKAPAPVPAPPPPPPPPVQTPGPQPLSSPPDHGKVLKIVVTLIVILVVVGIAALLSYLIIGGTKDDSALVIDQTQTTIADITETELIEDEESGEAGPGSAGDEIIKPTPEPAVEAVDTDRDGLTDLQEAEIGTNIRIADTDADGLSDYEEVNTWQTDPLDPDTDGDQFTDGDEVGNGYDPNGPGKLLELPEEEE